MTPSPPALTDLVVQLHLLNGRDRRAILARLEPYEREHVEGLLRKAKVRRPPSFDALAGLSPWLAESLAAARGDDKHRQKAALTPATREVLIDAERLLPRQAGEASEGQAPSLLQRLFAWGPSE